MNPWVVQQIKQQTFFAVSKFYINLKLHDVSHKSARISKKGPCEIRAKDIEADASVEILDVNTIDCLHVESDIARSGGRAMASLSDVALSSAMH